MHTNKKAILLAGGAGTRLFPLTTVVCKQLLPVYDKPLIYYPMASLMLGGIREILIISTPGDLPRIRELFGNGSQLGMEINYAEQAHPRGIAEAFLIGADFIGSSGVSLILGDNIFYGPLDPYRKALRRSDGACIFAYKVSDPERYGVVEFDKKGRAVAIEEKPSNPRTQFAVPGLYIYDNDVVDICRNLKPSSRGELEITDVNLEYLRRGKLYAEKLGRGMAWLDTGTHESLLDAANYIATIEKRQGLKVACVEEIAFNRGFIDVDGLAALTAKMPTNNYRAYLEGIVEEQRAGGG